MTAAPAFNGAVEFRPGFTPPANVTHVVFDFDGTLSLLRHGWPDLMHALFLEWLPPLPAENPAELSAELLDEIYAYNGQQTIHQMARFAERVRERGGKPRDPQWYLDEYLGRLAGTIRERTGRIGVAGYADEFVLHGGRDFLEQLARRRIKSYLLSSTLEPFVKQEAELLRLTRFFGSRIYGGQADHTQFSKRRILEQILREERMAGAGLLSLGDGPVEIRDTKALGGCAIAVASDESANGSGRIHPHKRRQLLAAGADVVVPDYRDVSQLTESWFARSP